MPKRKSARRIPPMSRGSPTLSPTMSPTELSVNPESPPGVVGALARSAEPLPLCRLASNLRKERK